MVRKSKTDRVNPTGTITMSCGEYLGKYIQSLLDEGRYSNASEIVREALREHEDHRNSIKKTFYYRAQKEEN